MIFISFIICWTIVWIKGENLPDDFVGVVRDGEDQAPVLAAGKEVLDASDLGAVYAATLAAAARRAAELAAQ